MNKALRVFLLIVFVLVSVWVYNTVKKRVKKEEPKVPIIYKVTKPKIALVFDDLGENLNELKELSSLHTPLTIAVIPGLKYSKDVAVSASDSGFSVLVHLPLEPKNSGVYKTSKYKFISSNMTASEAANLLRAYLSAVPFAIGANNHMGSLATEDEKLMRSILRVIKEKGLFFVDSHTSLKSVACSAAKKDNVSCLVNAGFIDAVSSSEHIEKKLTYLLKLAKKRKKTIIIGHPKKITLEILRKKLPALKQEVEFVTLKDYFAL